MEKLKSFPQICDLSTQCIPHFILFGSGFEATLQKREDRVELNRILVSHYLFQRSERAIADNFIRAHTGTPASVALFTPSRAICFTKWRYYVIIAYQLVRFISEMKFVNSYTLQCYFRSLNTKRMHLFQFKVPAFQNHSGYPKQKEISKLDIIQFILLHKDMDGPGQGLRHFLSKSM